jgi:hypothetical protein
MPVPRGPKGLNTVLCAIMDEIYHIRHMHAYKEIWISGIPRYSALHLALFRYSALAFFHVKTGFRC